MYREDAEDPGYVYILSNVSMPGLLKIGKSKDPEARSNQLSGSSVPTPFVVEFACYCQNAAKCESFIHEHLDCIRVNSRREFFECNLGYAIMAVSQMCIDFAIGDSKIEVIRDDNSVTPQRLGDISMNIRFDARVAFDFLSADAWKNAVARAKDHNGSSVMQNPVAMIEGAVQ